jgi:hypothetical protein
MSEGLLPSEEPAGSVRVDRELPEEARTWGRIVDLDALEPGDLLLFRSTIAEPDVVSRAIVDAQLRVLPERHARWTHAAVYLGDGEHICEANFKVPGAPNGVVMRSAYCYCDGLHAIRARRPKNMSSKTRLRIAIGALANLGAGYAFHEIVAFAKAVNGGRSWTWNALRRIPNSQVRAFVCSTLYQDAYNFALQGNTIRLGARSMPTHLSASPDFEDDEPPLRWLTIL